MAIVLLLLALLSGSGQQPADDPCTDSSCIFQQGTGTGG
jgi:hypothetical protein